MTDVGKVKELFLEALHIYCQLEREFGSGAGGELLQSISVLIEIMRAAEHDGRSEAIAAKAAQIDAEMQKAFDDQNMTGCIKIKYMAEYLSISEDTVKDRIQKGAARGSKLRCRDGFIFKENQ